MGRSVSEEVQRPRGGGGAEECGRSAKDWFFELESAKNLPTVNADFKRATAFGENLLRFAGS